ncbi:hypothetical protein TrCOL_g5298 [Triparma columacea]|uniref:COX assembly mitochondrial protein n=1 Tax=Triparma columacea TaxID=722753 RepID=A0A9W7GJZ9_9STRA|nr:hypothetical protein TrCOL_g5298 [Triparma columacea]
MIDRATELHTPKEKYPVIQSKELNAIAIKECAPFAKSFGDCAKAQGLLVVIRCRSENNALNSCLHGFTNPESFEKFKDKRAIEIAAKSNFNA